MIVIRACLGLLIVLLTSCATPNKNTSVNTDSLTDIQQLNNKDNDPTASGDEEKISQIRLDAVKETALTLGAQSGLAHRSKEINNTLQTERTELRNIFNFGALMLEHGIQPPVLISAENTLNYESPDVLRISDKTYKIVKQAQFVTVPATWQTYLWMQYKQPEIPHKTLLPRNDEEELIWQEYIAIGWKNGIRQANSIFQTNLARIKRDYNGMLLYRELLAKNMISKPYVAKTELGVTGDGNTMNINDQVLRITAASQLNTDTKEWRPILVK